MNNYELVDKIISVARAINDLKNTQYENEKYPDSPTPENWKEIVNIALRLRKEMEQMNHRDRQSLDRYITGSYGEDQFKKKNAVHEQMAQRCANGKYCVQCMNVIHWWNTPIRLDPDGQIVVHHSCLIDFAREMFTWIG